MKVIKDDYISKIEVVRILQKAYAEGRIKAKDSLASVLDDINAADVRPVNRWISVEDRLPEIGKSVLVAIIINAKLDLPFRKDYTSDIRIGWLDDNGEWGLMFDSADRDEILYWQPLPQLPKDGEQNE